MPSIFETVFRIYREIVPPNMYSITAGIVFLCFAMTFFDALDRFWRIIGR